jgi:RHS repeat-associated protein
VAALRSWEFESPSAHDGTQVILELDTLGRLHRMTDDLGTTTYGYDEFSRLTSVARSGQPPITYTYDTENRITSMSVGNETTIYTYDFLGRLASMDTPAGTVSYNYLTGQGQLIRTLPNGVQTIWEFEPDGNLGQLTHASADNTILARFTYDYRPDGLISQIQEWSPTEQKTLAYEYDEVQRLVAVNDSVLGRTEYEYDAVGNRTVLREPGQAPVESTYDWANRLKTYDGQAVTYDAAGNLTQYLADEDQRVFEYDASGLLDQVSVDGQVMDYEYDGDGNLVQRIFDGSTTDFVADPFSDIWRPLQITDDGGTTSLIWEGETPLGTSAAGEEVFYLQDYLGSVRFAVDENGNVIDELDYDVFGALESSFSRNELQAGFTGLLFDLEAEVYVTKYRTYEPNLGQFFQYDPKPRIPFEFQKDYSTYGYTGQDPVNFIDRADDVPKYLGQQDLYSSDERPLYFYSTNADSVEQLIQGSFQRDISILRNKFRSRISPLAVNVRNATDILKQGANATLNLLSGYKGIYSNFAIGYAANSQWGRIPGNLATRATISTLATYSLATSVYKYAIGAQQFFGLVPPAERGGPTGRLATDLARLLTDDPVIINNVTNVSFFGGLCCRETYIKRYR